VILCIIKKHCQGFSDLLHEAVYGVLVALALPLEPLHHFARLLQFNALRSLHNVCNCPSNNICKDWDQEEVASIHIDIQTEISERRGALPPPPLLPPILQTLLVKKEFGSHRQMLCVLLA